MYWGILLITALGGDDERARFLRDVKLRSAWRTWWDASYWTHAWVVSLGNKLNVSEAQMKAIVRYTGLRLKRRIWGKDRDQRPIDFWAFEQFGAHCKSTKLALSDAVSGQHWHVLVHVSGKHGWSDEEIFLEMKDIIAERKARNQQLRTCGLPTDDMVEKAIHVDYNWHNGNRYHTYSARDVSKEEKIVGVSRHGARLLIEQRDNSISFRI